jgi:peptide/nickel transport system substrate-binding protein
MGDDGVRVSPDGERMSLRLLGRQESSESQKVVEYVKDWLAQIGIEVNVNIVSEDTLYEKVGNGDFDMFEWGWVVEPDPDYQLSTFTCDQRSTDDDGTIFAGLSDSFYCDAAYDKLFQEQKLETDPAKRAEIVRAMQQMLYDSNAYVVTVYYDNPTAYRSDRWTNFTPQPAPDGVLLFQYGTWSYESIEPVSADAGVATSTGRALSPGLILGAVVAGVGLFLIGYWLGRRRPSDYDVE